MRKLAERTGRAKPPAIGLAALIILILLTGCSGRADFPRTVPAPVLAQPILPTLGSLPDNAEPKVEIGFYAPDFELVDLRGNSVSLSQYSGQTVLLNFWASWCAPCREEIPLLEAVYEAYAASGLVVLAVNMGEDERRVRGFAEDLSMAFPVLIDESTSVGSLYRVRGAPTTYFIDADGVIRQRYVGALSANALVEILSGRAAFPNG